MKRMVPPTTPTMTPAIEPLVNLCVSFVSIVFERSDPVGTAGSVFEAVVETETVEELGVVEKGGVDDMVEVVLLLVEVVILKLSDVMTLVGVDIVGLDMGVDIDGSSDVGVVIEDGIGSIFGEIVFVLGRLTTVGTFCDAVAADVPGSDAGAVHWNPSGTAEGASVPVYVMKMGTIFAVGAAVGTNG